LGRRGHFPSDFAGEKKALNKEKEKRSLRNIYGANETFLACAYIITDHIPYMYACICVLQMMFN